ncbi:hypothetical protein M434DRAFT_395396 [Hypoxylon sp. CO27-5]|nr:hypothetical protein M434DRAFT_395396 [Hypoxylon sp. CO27-5]
MTMGPVLSFPQILATIPLQALWSYSNLLLFNLHNQRRYITEDALNKPWRPLPSGRLTSQDTTWIMYCMYPVTIIIALKCGGLTPCLLEMVLCLWYNEWGGSDDAVLKNLINGSGIGCFLAGPLEVATGRSIFSSQGKAAIWIAIMASAAATTGMTQDFRDIKGDKAVGRKTIPLVIGNMNARLLVTSFVGIFTCLSCWFWETEWRESLFSWLTASVLVANLVLNRTWKGDNLSWKVLWFLWLSGLFSLPVFMFSQDSLIRRSG